MPFSVFFDLALRFVSCTCLLSHIDDFHKLPSVFSAYLFQLLAKLSMPSTAHDETHALSKPTHFFPQLYIATMFNSFQTSFNSAMIDSPDMILLEKTIF